MRIFLIYRLFGLKLDPFKTFERCLNSSLSTQIIGSQLDVWLNLDFNFSDKGEPPQRSSAMSKQFANCFLKHFWFKNFDCQKMVENSLFHKLIGQPIGQTVSAHAYWFNRTDCVLSLAIIFAGHLADSKRIKLLVRFLSENCWSTTNSAWWATRLHQTCQTLKRPSSFFQAHFEVQTAWLTQNSNSKIDLKSKLAASAVPALNVVSNAHLIIGPLVCTRLWQQPNSSPGQAHCLQTYESKKIVTLVRPENECDW